MMQDELNITAPIYKGESAGVTVEQMQLGILNAWLHGAGADFLAAGEEWLLSTTALVEAAEATAILESVYDCGVTSESSIISGGEFERGAEQKVHLTDESVDFHVVSSEELRLEIEHIFAAASEEEFEDGMDNAFTQAVLRTVRQHGNIAVNELAHLILNAQVSSECAGEALKWLGDMEHEPTRLYRRWLLEKALVQCPSMIARDGANVGLALMDDPHAIPFLKKAIEASASPLFSEMLLQTLHQLEETRKCHGFSG